MIIAVDFDGTCVMHEYPDIGESIGAEEVLIELIEQGHKIILFTMRSGRELQEAVKWFEDRKIKLFGVNQNPEQSSWTTSPKPYAQIYIDDAAIGCPLIKWWHERDYVDWEEVKKLLKNRIK